MVWKGCSVMPRHTRTRIFCDKRNGIGRRFREPSKRLAAYGCPAVYGQLRSVAQLSESSHSYPEGNQTGIKTLLSR